MPDCHRDARSGAGGQGRTHAPRRGLRLVRGAGSTWNVGAPLPHLISNGLRSIVVCHAARVDPHWDGTSATVVSPSDPEPAQLLEFTFDQCHATRFGSPNDEVLHGHPLFSRGLDGYRPHLVHNSAWIADEEAINSVHPMHRGGWRERLNHYFFVFHDEVFEAIAQSVTVRTVRATMSEAMRTAVATFAES